MPASIFNGTAVKILKNILKFADGTTLSSTVAGYLSTLSSNAQTQIDAKQARGTLSAKGDLYVATASATVARQGVGTDGTFLKADSTQTNGVVWATASDTLAYRSITSTDSLNAITDSFALLSGASFTLTLPTAVGNTGKTFRIKHGGTSNTQVYTIEGDGTETIDGALNQKLWQFGEELTVVSNGSNWFILGKIYNPVILTAFKNGGAITAVTTIASYTTETKDSHAAFDLTAGEYTVVVPGDYYISWHGRQTSANTAAAEIIKNGNAVVRGSQITTTASKQVHAILPDLVAGDVISIWHTASATLTSSDTENYLSIMRVAG